MSDGTGRSSGRGTRYNPRMPNTTSRARRGLPTALALTAALAGCGGAAESPALDHAPEAGEEFFTNVKQITFGGQNAEAYFSPDGKQLIFQRTESDTTCDQQYIINVDGSGLELASSGLGRTTCGFFHSGGERILYSSTYHVDEQCPPSPDFSRTTRAPVLAYSTNS